MIHYDMPKSVEAFYQESGRAGRDGKKALSVVFYSQDDARALRLMTNKSLKV